MGTALGLFAWLLPWVYFKVAEPEKFYVLSYTRNDGEFRWPVTGVTDPAAAFPNISDYPVQIAMLCKVSRWSTATDYHVSDIDHTARLRIAESLVDDRVLPVKIYSATIRAIRTRPGTANHKAHG